MEMLARLTDRAIKFKTIDLVRESGLSRALVSAIVARKRSGVNLDSYAKLEAAVSKLEESAPRKNAERKPKVSRSKAEAGVR